MSPSVTGIYMTAGFSGQVYKMLPRWENSAEAIKSRGFSLLSGPTQPDPETGTQSSQLWDSTQRITLSTRMLQRDFWLHSSLTEPSLALL